MKLFLQIISILLIISSSLIAYEDEDIDGVKDSQDLCPHTPFDELVDTNGCSSNQMTFSSFTLQIGNDFSFDTFSKRSNNLNIYANYLYKDWDFSLSSSNYNLTNLNTNSTEENNLFLTVGHFFTYEKLKTKLSLGTKFAFMDDKELQRDNDYYASAHFDYYPSSKQNIYLYCNYTLSGQSNDTEIHYNDFASFSLGTGYMLTSQWYSALSYNYSGTLYNGIDDYKALSWFNSYSFTKKFYMSLNYAYTLSDATPQHILSLNIGVHFE